MSMKHKSLSGRVVAWLGSLRLSVVVMVAIAGICAYATFYESWHGTEAVQRDVYQTAWFAALLGLLALNVLAAMVTRWPWSRHQAGFLVAHAGILLVLAGSVVSLYGGLDSTMALYEGETSARVSLPEQSLQLRIPARGIGATFPVRFDTHPPRAGQELRLALPGTDVVLVALEHWRDGERSAVLVRLEAGGARGESFWVSWGELRRAAIGSQAATVAFQPPQAALPFSVTLLKFSNESYPGSRMAATYESTVRVDDPERGSFEALVAMNRPLHHRGYVFFQSSFVEGQPMVSIFSVARAPGLPLVYLGTALIGAGIVWMTYLKPWLVKRQAARALAARSAREIEPHDASPARPVTHHA